MKQRKKVLTIVLLVSLMFSSLSFAHSGRTDSNGGHRDNQNKSGLGYYHYHHGYGPHLHEGGVCPYAKPAVVELPEEYTYYKNFTKETIKDMQTHLNALGYNCGTADGIIGAKTITAIKNLQGDNNMIANGKADTTTLELIYQDVVDIKAVQSKLNELGYDCGIVDGIIGKKTINQIRAFQQDHSLTVNGDLDAPTIEKLNIK